MTTTAIQVPAGWYPDPLAQTVGGQPTHRRWWDGAQWTDHVEALRPAAAPSSPEISTAAVAAARDYAATQVASPSSYTATSSAPVTLTPRDSARAARSMSLHSVSADSAPAASASSVASATIHSAYSAHSPASAVDAGSTHRRHRRRADHGAHADVAAPGRPRVYTASIWLMATMPLTQAMLVYYVFTNLPPESSAWTRALTLVFPFILSAALAGQDTRLMALAGHLRTAPWVSALIVPPVYLALRSARIGRSTGAIAWPLYLWFLSQAVVLAVWWMVDPQGVMALVDIVL